MANLAPRRRAYKKIPREMPQQKNFPTFYAFIHLKQRIFAPLESALPDASKSCAIGAENEAILKFDNSEAGDNIACELRGFGAAN